jgi:hypothetical protein
MKASLASPNLPSHISIAVFTRFLPAPCKSAILKQLLCICLFICVPASVTNKIPWARFMKSFGPTLLASSLAFVAGSTPRE